MKNMKQGCDTHAGSSDIQDEKLQRAAQTEYDLPQDGGVNMDCPRSHANSAEEGRPDTGAPCADGECVLSDSKDGGVTHQSSMGLPR